MDATIVTPTDDTGRTILKNSGWKDREGGSYEKTFESVAREAMALLSLKGRVKVLSKTCHRGVSK